MHAYPSNFYERLHRQAHRCADMFKNTNLSHFGYGYLPGSGSCWWRGSSVRPMHGAASSGEERTCPRQAPPADQSNPSLVPGKLCWKDTRRLAPRPPRRNPVVAPRTALPPGDAASASPASRYGRTYIFYPSAGCCPLAGCRAPRTAVPSSLQGVEFQ